MKPRSIFSRESVIHVVLNQTTIQDFHEIIKVFSIVNKVQGLDNITLTLKERTRRVWTYQRG